MPFVRHEPLALARADAFALRRNRLHALGQSVGFDQRHGNREDRRHRCDRNKNAEEKLRVRQLRVNEIEHFA